MALPSSGPLTIADIQTEFGGAIPASLSEYYSGGSFVASGTSGTYGLVPSSGQLSIQNFYGTSAEVPGVNWTYRLSLNLAMNNNRTDALIRSNSQYLAVGNNAACATSPDGITWTRRTGLAGVLGDNHDVLAAAWTGSNFGVTGNSGRFATSPDGITWTRQTNFTTTFGDNGSPNAVVWTGSLYVVVGVLDRDAKCVTSSNGVTWNSRPSFYTAFTTTTPNSIANSGSFLVVVGSSSKCATSPDGITWTNQPGFASAVGPGKSFNAITRADLPGGAVYVAVGNNAVCATSPDGITWTNQPGLASAIGSTGSATAVAWISGQIVAVGYAVVFGSSVAKCATSPDGVTWTNQPNFTSAFGSNKRPRAVALTNSQYAVAGDNSNCATSP